jgi:hypothetical protein
MELKHSMEVDCIKRSAEAIIGFEPFRYLLSKDLVQIINEKLASCLVVFPVILIELGGDGY